MSGNYGSYIYSTCTAAGVLYGDTLARAVGYKGLGPAFGGECGLGARPIGSGATEPTHYVLYTIANNDRAPYVAEFNGAGPYTLLGELGASNGFIAACKGCMIVEMVPTPEDIDAYADIFLAAHGLERMPET